MVRESKERQVREQELVSESNISISVINWNRLEAVLTPVASLHLTADYFPVITQRLGFDFPVE